jgi:hypothetical protein
LKKKVDKFELEINKMWNYVQDQSVATNKSNLKVEEKTENVDFTLGVSMSRIVDLETQNKNLNHDVLRQMSQSMRNNLVFGNIPEEAQPGISEDTEKVLREFLVDKMKFAKEMIAQIQFERVHRTGERVDRKHRKIVAKFTLFKEKELVRKSWKALENTSFYLHKRLLIKDVYERDEK